MKYPMRKSLKLVALAATVLMLAGSSAMTARAQSDRVVLNPGTVIPVTLNNELSSSSSVDGDTFTANVDTSREAYDSIMRGATLDGVVKHAVPQSGNDPGTLQLAFTRLHLQDGTSYVISGAPTSLDSKNLTVRDNGILAAKSTKQDKSLTYAGIGAGAGALISVLNGGKLRIEDLLIGGGLGYVAGQLLKQPAQVHDVDLAAGTPVGVLLSKSVLYHRHMHRNLSYTDGSYRATDNSNLRYYTYNGERWSYNPATGERRTVSSDMSQPTRRAGRKYFSYQGHPYYMDLNTGERVRLD